MRILLTVIFVWLAFLLAIAFVCRTVEGSHIYPREMIELNRGMKLPNGGGSRPVVKKRKWTCVDWYHTGGDAFVVHKPMYGYKGEVRTFCREVYDWGKRRYIYLEKEIEL